MSTKRRQSRSQQSRRAAERKKAKARQRTYLMIGLVVVVAVALVAIIALASRPGPSSEPGGQASMDKSMGSETAPVVVVEYADFQCPFCKQFATGTKVQLGEEYIGAGEVRFAFRHFAFIGDESTWAAEASECANEQGQFWQYHDKLFEEQGAENSGAFTRDNLKRYAADLGLDTTQFNECVDKREYRDKVQQEIREAQNLRLNSTPSILVNGNLVPNGASYPTLKVAVDAALSQD